jgi:hypothetical protein
MNLANQMVGIAALLLAGAAFAGDAAQGSGQVTIDRGVLTAIRESGVLRLNLATGEVTVSAGSAAVGRPLAMFLPANTGALLKLEFAVLGASQTEAGACADESAVVTSTANTAVLACSHGQTATCKSSMKAFNDAVEAFNACMEQVQEPPVEP